MRRFLSWLTACCAGICLPLAPAANAQTFDPDDPFRTDFLDILSAMVDVAVPVSKKWVEIRKNGGSPEQIGPQLAELQRLNLALQQELQQCGDGDRVDIRMQVDRLLRASFEAPERMQQLGYTIQIIQAGYRTDVERINDLAPLLDANFLTLADFNGDGRVGRDEPSPIALLEAAGSLFNSRGFYRSLLAIGSVLEAKAALPLDWETRHYPQAMFFLGEIDQLRDYANDHAIDLVDDWLITAALRAGAEDEALAIQRRIDAVDPDNLSRILFFDSEGARAAHCGNMMQAIRESLSTDQNESEAGLGRTWFGSWRMLLCGNFADARRAALKATWAERQGRCAAKRTNVDLTNQYNAILSGAYQAAELRADGALDAATELLDKVAEEVRQALFLDSFTGYSSLEIVIDDDIAIYMARLHGPRPELSVVKGMLERGRGDIDAAIADFRQAMQLSGVGPEDSIAVELNQSLGLSVEWLLRLNEWIDELEAVDRNGS